MAATRLNAFDQALDIAGSLVQQSNLNLLDEPAGLGLPLVGQTGASAAVTAINANDVTITGLTGMTLQSVGNFIQFTGGMAGNQGTFLVDTFISATSVTVVNPNAVVDAGPYGWTERYPYSLLEDLNFERTDRTNIKGVPYFDPIPTFARPNATNVQVPANLSNIAGKTTDAVAYNVNRAFFGVAVATGNTQVTITSAGQLKHAGAVATDITGIPCFDINNPGPFTGDWVSCYVHIVDGYASGSELIVLSGPHVGERVFGQTFQGASTSPNSVEIHFFSAPFNVNYATDATPYVWEAGQTPTINVLYGYNEMLNNLDENAFRTVPALGILTDAQLSAEIQNIFNQLGTTDGYNNLNGFLTNTSTFFPFFNLDATPTVVEALNVLNQQIGNTTFTGPYLTNNGTVTLNLQALSDAISTSGVITRTIERVTTAITRNTAHTLPGGLTYVLDPTNNGQFMFVTVRGKWTDPGPASGNNDYSETSTTSITFYYDIKAGDHINYLIK
jgi:hypothetical protein